MKEYKSNEKRPRDAASEKKRKRLMAIVGGVSCLIVTLLVLVITFLLVAEMYANDFLDSRGVTVCGSPGSLESFFHGKCEHLRIAASSMQSEIESFNVRIGT